MLAVLWGPSRCPATPAERYFTRLTIIDTGPVSYRAGGKAYHLPVTVSDPLVPTGGA